MENTGKKVCRHGLNDIWINNADGSVKICCWPNYFIGDLTKQSIEEIWHGKKAEEFRQSMLDGSYQFCDPDKCPYCANETLEEHLVDYEVPEYPTMCSLSYQWQCNYVCKFCRDCHYVGKTDEESRYQLIESEVQKMLPTINKISANGAGELFCSNSILRLLENINTDNNINIELETNGSLFNEDNWKKISNLGKYNLSVYVTVHSFEEDTYQYLSGTKLPVKNIIDNLFFISKLREQNIINHLEIATVICERNFREMPSFVERCLSDYSMDKIRLRFFEPYGVMDRATEWFYDVRNPYHPYYEEFVRVMDSPVLKNEKVWKFQGNKLSRQKEAPYVLEHRNFIDISNLILTENLEDKIKAYCSKYNNPRIAIYGAGKGGRAITQYLHAYGMEINTIFDTYEKESEGPFYHIVSPDNSRIKEYDIIIVSQNLHYEQIRELLLRMCYDGQIISINDFVEELMCM